MAFQENLRFYREKAGYKQAKEFAAAIGVNYSTYIGYENQGKEPKYETLLRIAAALNVSIDTLLDFSGVDRYEEYKHLVIAAGYDIEEDGEKVIIVAHEQRVKAGFSRIGFCYMIGKSLQTIDELTQPIKREFIRQTITDYIRQEPPTPPQMPLETL